MRKLVPVALVGLSFFAASVVVAKTKSAPRRPAPAAATASEPAPAAAAAASGDKCHKPAKAACSGANVAFTAANTTPFTQSAGDSPALAAADVNNDGKTDLLVSHTNGSIDVLLSKGDGTFDLGKTVDARVAGYGLGAVDLDGDCNADLVFSSFGSGSVGRTVDVQAGKGNGKFGLPQNYGIGVDNCTKMEFIDLNGDHRIDIAYDGNSGGLPAFNFGNGKGAFGPSRVFDTKFPWTFGDVTGDGVADWIDVDSTNGRGMPAVCVHANNGRGQFADPVCSQLTANANAKFVRVADVNGDGKLDVIAFTNENDSYFNVLLNLGGGKLDDREKYKSSPCNGFVMADTNNDGKSEIVCYWANSSGGLMILPNDGDGTFKAKAEQYPFGGESSRSEEVLVAGDWLGNGLIGFATIDRSHDAVSVISGECR